MGLITGETILDHFLINCSRCNDQVNIKLFNSENRLSCIEYTCKNCGNYGILKLNQSKTEVINN
jgi:hypothetical protein